MIEQQEALKIKAAEWLAAVIDGGIIVEVDNKEHLFDADHKMHSYVTSMAVLSRMGQMLLYPIFSKDGECFSFTENQMIEFSYDYLVSWAAIYNEYGRKLHMIATATSIQELEQISFGTEE